MKILFICSGNTCRSPMAQALLLRELNKKNIKMGISVSSAGTMAYPGAPASDEAINVMIEYDIDLSNHHARKLDAEIIKQADLVLTMAAAQAAALRKSYPHKQGSIFQASQFAGLGDKDVEDPFGSSISTYRRTAEQINELVEIIADRLAHS